MDRQGNVYVAENCTIRKVTSNGVVTTLAGSAGQAGSVDGAGSAARFSHPEGVAVDGEGNVFVADTQNCTIRKVTSSGVVTTLAGDASRRSGLYNGFGGYEDGSGSKAWFNLPSGVAVDGEGNVFVADTYNDTIRKMTSHGLVTRLAGSAGVAALREQLPNWGSTDGTGSEARFHYPHGLALDSVGNLFVADTGNHTIRKVARSGVVTTLAGSAYMGGSRRLDLGYPAGGQGDGTGAEARFNQPIAVAVDGEGNVFVADTENCTIRKMTSALG